MYSLHYPVLFFLPLCFPSSRPPVLRCVCVRSSTPYTYTTHILRQLVCSLSFQCAGRVLRCTFQDRAVCLLSSSVVQYGDYRTLSYTTCIKKRICIRVARKSGKTLSASYTVGRVAVVQKGFLFLSILIPCLLSLPICWWTYSLTLRPTSTLLRLAHSCGDGGPTGKVR